MYLMRENILKLLILKCIVRPTLVYGSNDPPMVIAKFIRNAQSKKDISLFGKGEGIISM